MKTILAAVDASPQRNAVLAATARMAAQFEAAVHVVSVAATEASWASALGGEAVEVMQDQTGEVLRAACGELAARGVACTTHVAIGPVAREIAQTAAQVGAELIVIGHRDLGWLDKLVEGSVGQRLLDLAPCNVLVVMDRAGS